MADKTVNGHLEPVVSSSEAWSFDDGWAQLPLSHPCAQAAINLSIAASLKRIADSLSNLEVAFNNFTEDGLAVYTSPQE